MFGWSVIMKSSSSSVVEMYHYITKCWVKLNKTRSEKSLSQPLESTLHTDFPEEQSRQTTTINCLRINKRLRHYCSPFNAQSGGQVGSVSICDVGVLPQKQRDLFIGVQSDSSRHQHRPVLITSQLNVVCRLSALLGFLRHGWAVGLCLSLTWSWKQRVRSK